MAPSCGDPAFHIREIAVDTDWAWDALHDVEVAITTELHGEDLAPSADGMRHSYTNEVSAIKAALVAVPGPAPEEHLDRTAAMNRTMSADAPSGDLDWQPGHRGHRLACC